MQREGFKTSNVETNEREMLSSEEKCDFGA